MKFLVDFFPVLAFFTAYFIPDDRSHGIYWATSAAIAASIIQVTAIWLMRKKVEKMHLITLAIILVLGSATPFATGQTFYHVETHCRQLGLCCNIFRQPVYR